MLQVRRLLGKRPLLLLSCNVIPFGQAAAPTYSTSTSQTTCSVDPDITTPLLQSFKQNPLLTANQLAQSLTPAQQAILTAALREQSRVPIVDDKYVEELFEAADTNFPKGVLTRSEFQQALLAHQSLVVNQSKAPPARDALKMIFLASAIPFVGFGFLDNFVMILAGEEIDNAFGKRLGLSTLASAGLGNLVADVIGVGAASFIEQGVRKLSFIKDPKLSKYQYAMRSAKAAKAIGATLGVMCGCLMGLAPLFMTGSFFVTRS